MHKLYAAPLDWPVRCRYVVMGGDLANRYREAGMDATSDMRKAAPERLRPVLMAALAAFFRDDAGRARAIRRGRMA